MPAVHWRLANNFGVDEIRARVAGWPESVLRCIETAVEAAHPGAWLRLLTAFQCGVDLGTGYSGIDAPGVALVLLELAIKRRGLDTGIGVSRSDATEIDPKCRKFLKSFPVAAHKHVFSDILEKLHKDVQKALAELEPHRDDAKHVRERKVRDMALVLKKYEGQLYRSGRTGYCDVHDTQCKYHDADPNIESSALRVHVAGTTCKDASLMNASTRSTGSRESGPAARVLLVWCMERRNRQSMF